VIIEGPIKQKKKSIDQNLLNAKQGKFEEWKSARQATKLEQWAKQRPYIVNIYQTIKS
jgi:hypothetical protein